MLCSRCVRGAQNALRQPAVRVAHPTKAFQIRSFGAITSLPTRPTMRPTRPTTSLNPSSVAETALQPLPSITGLSITQVRGAKRDTYKPSHVVRKRRHGYLSRIRTRTGRKTLLRRRLKGRTTLSH